jgi:hypothetical protein
MQFLLVLFIGLFVHDLKALVQARDTRVIEEIYSFVADHNVLWIRRSFVCYLKIKQHHISLR